MNLKEQINEEIKKLDTQSSNIKEMLKIVHTSVKYENDTSTGRSLEKALTCISSVRLELFSALDNVEEVERWKYSEIR